MAVIVATQSWRDFRRLRAYMKPEVGRHPLVSLATDAFNPDLYLEGGEFYRRRGLRRWGLSILILVFTGVIVTLW